MDKESGVDPSGHYITIHPSIKNGEKTIKHMVISGGAFNGLTYYGAIRELSKQNYWKIENIKTIHGTSVGSLISVLIALNYDWEVIDDYFIKRPWQHMFKTTTLSMIESVISKMGIYTNKIIEDTFQPLFAGKDLSLDITMKEFYELNGIEIHMYTTDLNTFQTINMSYKTHPDWRVVDVIYCSSCMPIVFTPFLFEDAAYVDGGFYSNYPLQQCLEDAEDPLEIVGIYRMLSKNKTKIINGSTIIDYLSILLNEIIERIIICQQTTTVGIEGALPGISTEYSIFREIILKPEERKKYMDIGASYVMKEE